jgi:hypothetical protein
MQPPPVADPRAAPVLETKWYWLESTTWLVDLEPFEGHIESYATGNNRMQGKACFIFPQKGGPSQRFSVNRPFREQALRSHESGNLRENS